MQVTKKQDVARLRRIALTSQGLLGQAPFGTGTKGCLAAIERLSY